jgi:DNA-binding HxlR family transcriptional regulator
MFTANLCSDRACPIQFILGLISSKWAVPILQELLHGKRRTYELLEALPGISSKTLMVRLRELETHGLVDREIFAEIPPHVEYSLTAKGQELQPVLTALYQLGNQWLGPGECHCAMTTSHQFAETG